MTRHFPALPRPAHRMLCVLLVWVMLVAPLIVMAGEIHELEHVTGADTAAVTLQSSTVMPGADAVGDLLHELADATHCCGHIAAVLPGSPSFDVVTLRSNPMRWVGFTRDRHLAFLPFRPPIRG